MVKSIQCQCTISKMKLSLALLVGLALWGAVVAGRITPSDVAKDRDDFLKLLPQKEMAELVAEYIGNDLEVQTVIQYAMTEEFRALMTRLENLKEVRAFYAYLYASGFDIYAMVNMYNDAIGVAPISPEERAFAMKLTGGTAGLMKDLRALLPADKIKALYNEKLKTSPAFAYMVDRFRSPQVQALIDAMYANEEYVRIMTLCNEKRFPFNQIIVFATSLFGLNTPLTRFLDEPMMADEILKSPKSALVNDLHEFVELLPAEEIRKIATKHYLFDSEFRKTINYVRSEQFYVLVRKVHAIPEYNELLGMLEALGLDVQSAIRSIHDAIKFPGHFMTKSVIEQRSLASFITEVKAALPIDQIKALYLHKVETSPDFKKLVEVVSSEKFQAVTNALFADVDFQDFLHKAQSHGVNLKAVSDFFFTVFGVTTPPGIID